MKLKVFIIIITLLSMFLIYSFFIDEIYCKNDNSIENITKQGDNGDSVTDEKIKDNSTDESLIEIEYENYNKYISEGINNGEEWTNHIEDIVEMILYSKTEYFIENEVSIKKEGGSKVVVNVDGLKDDSIKSVKYIFNFDKDSKDNWYITKLLWGQKCHSERGQQNYKGEP